MRTLQSITVGSSGIHGKSQMEMGPIKEVLGDAMPSLTPDPLGEYRLMNALRNKFGPSFRDHPSAAGAIKHFQKEYNYFKKLRSVMSGQGGNQNG